MLQYQITAQSQKGGPAQALAHQTEISFDASADRDALLPNPAELLLTALAACILKNVERYSEILHYPYQSARITVKDVRSDRPPAIQKIDYLLEVDTNIDERKLQNWHKNIIKFGTISNTLAKATGLNGSIKYMDKAE
jgi:uncharacterized OsmC-like protein